MSDMTTTVRLIAESLGAPFVGADGDTPVIGVCSVLDPLPGHLCFATDDKWLSTGDPGRSGAITLCRAEEAEMITGARIIVDVPRRAFGIAVEKHFVSSVEPMIAKSARIDPSAQLGEGVSIGENCVIGADVSIGAHSKLRHNIVLAAGVRIGAHCVIGSNTVIGEVGFGVAKDADGRGHRLPHLGSVEIGDFVEIGASVTVAAGTINPTRLAEGSRLDDQVFIGHNVQLSENVMVTACAQLSGSVEVGRNTWISPCVSVRDGLKVPAESFIGIGSTLVKTYERPGIYAGTPARFMRDNDA